jgi:hypothetical protein
LMLGPAARPAMYQLTPAPSPSSTRTAISLFIHPCDTHTMQQPRQRSIAPAEEPHILPGCSSGVN